MIKAGKDKSGTSAFNQVCGILQVNQDKNTTIHHLELEWKKVHCQINQRKIIMNVFKNMQNISDKV